MSDETPTLGAAVLLAALHRGEHSDDQLTKLVSLGTFLSVCSLLVDEELIQRDASQQIWVLTDKGRSSIDRWLAA